MSLWLALLVVACVLTRTSSGAMSEVGMAGYGLMTSQHVSVNMGCGVLGGVTNMTDGHWQQCHPWHCNALFDHHLFPHLYI